MTVVAGTASATTAVEVSHVEKSFGAVRALRGVSFQLAAGEVAVLVGANAAGKSTLLRILGTTLLPDAGTVRVAGHDVTASPARVRRIVGLMIGDERSWYWRLTGRKNLEFFAVLHGLNRRHAAERAGALLSQVGLADAADRRFDGYSSGMRARLSLARSLISEPEVLLLDEPTRSLDPTAAATFRETVTRLARERSATVLFVTHDLHEAAEVATRTIGLAAGLVAFDTRERLSATELERLLVDASP